MKFPHEVPQRNLEIDTSGESRGDDKEKIPSREEVLQGMKVFSEEVQQIFGRILELQEEQKQVTQEGMQSIEDQFSELSDEGVQERISNPTEIQQIQSKNEGDYYANRQIELGKEEAYFWEKLGKVDPGSVDGERALADYKQLFNRFIYKEHKGD